MSKKTVSQGDLMLPLSLIAFVISIISLLVSFGVFFKPPSIYQVTVSGGDSGGCYTACVTTLPPSLNSNTPYYQPPVNSGITVSPARPSYPAWPTQPCRMGHWQACGHAFNHLVKPNETLWGISQAYFGTGTRWYTLHTTTCRAAACYTGPLPDQYHLLPGTLITNA